MVAAMDSLILTFAELDFLLRSRPEEQVGEVREQLHLMNQASDVGASGLASLLARGLCVVESERVVPSAELVAVVAGLTTVRIRLRMTGWVSGELAFLHLFFGDVAKLALFPAPFGQFVVEPLDPATSWIDQVTRFLDACISSDAESVVAIQSVRNGEKVSIAVATDEAGAWYLSDSEESPDRGLPSTRDAVIVRIGELLDSGQAAGVR